MQALPSDVAGVVLLGPEDLPQAHRGGWPGDGEEGHQLTGLGRGRVREGDIRAVALDPVAAEDVDPHGRIDLGGGRRELLGFLAPLTNPEGIRRRVGTLEDAIGEDKVSAETRGLARSLLASQRRRLATDPPVLHVVAEWPHSATGT